MVKKFFNRKNYIHYGLILTIFIWIIFSNDILLNISGHKQPNKCSAVTNTNEEDFCYHLESVSLLNDWAQTIEITGWAFGYCQQEKNYRAIKLYLQSQEQTYEFSIDNPDDINLYKWKVTRTELVDSFKHFDLKDREVGFIGECSLLNIKDGTYELYLDISENETHQGIVRLNKNLIKEADSIEIDDVKSEKRETIINEGLNNNLYAYGGIENVEKKGNEFLFSGYVYCDGERSSGQEAYIKLTDASGQSDYYETVKTVKTGLNSKNEMYAMSGFQGLLDIKEGDYTASVLIVENNKVYETSAQIIRITDDDVELDGDTSSQFNEISAKYNNELLLNGYIDDICVADGKINILGWCTDDDSSDNKIYLYLAHDGKKSIYSVKQFEKEGLKKIYHKAYKNCGFFASICSEGKLDGQYMIQVIIVNKNGEMTKSRDTIFNINNNKMSEKILPICLAK